MSPSLSLNKNTEIKCPRKKEKRGKRLCYHSPLCYIYCNLRNLNLFPCFITKFFPFTNIKYGYIDELRKITKQKETIKNCKTLPFTKNSVSFCLTRTKHFFMILLMAKMYCKKRLISIEFLQG